MIGSSTPLNPVSRRIQELMRGHTDREEEAEIISLLADADRTTLNESLNQLELAHLFNDVDDRLIGPDNLVCAGSSTEATFIRPLVSKAEEM